MAKAPLIAAAAALLTSSNFMSLPVESLTVSTRTEHFVGFDLGTSGARISVIEKSGTLDSDSASGDKQKYSELYSDAISWDDKHMYDDESSWVNAVETLLRRASELHVLGNVVALCASGTSASCLLVDSDNRAKPMRSPRMYDYDIVASSDEDTDVSVYGMQAAELLDRYAPPQHTARARTGSLAKLLKWNEESPLKPGEVLSHQADYIATFLTCDPKHSSFGLSEDKIHVVSDWHNCLKLGYDVQNLCWPSWFVKCLNEGAGIPDPTAVVPSRVVSPGEVIGKVSSSVAKQFGIPDNAVIVGGTTDSNAAFFAAVGGTSPEFGAAVTSLGSTLAIKHLSRTFCEDATRGVYSHRFPTYGHTPQERAEGWLVGGASNVGCAVLRQQGFSNEELEQLSEQIDPLQDSPLEYYPLTKKGERFPVADGERAPLLSPVPDGRKEYLHGILQGISKVERDGFAALGDLGASPGYPSIVWSCGGGARNDMWLQMRERCLEDLCGREKVKVRRAANTEASFGAAILAAATF